MLAYYQELLNECIDIQEHKKIITIFKEISNLMRKKMYKTVSRNKIDKSITCEECVNCIYEENGNMYCDKHKKYAYVYNEFWPSENYMWCKGNKYIKR